MKVLVSSLIAGLALSLSLAAKADTTTMKCTLGVGEELVTRSVLVTNPAMTSMDFEALGVRFTASAVYDVVNVYAKIGGVTVGNSGNKKASLDVFNNNEQPVSLSCALVIQIDHYCDEL